jgi:hypothetical protein
LNFYDPLLETVGGFLLENTMKAHELAKVLLQMENVEVMFTDPNSGDGGPFSVCRALEMEAEEDEFPEEYNMPAGFRYIHLTNL